MSKVVMVTVRYKVAGEVVEEITYPITGKEVVDSVGAGLKVKDFEGADLTVDFIFEAPGMIVGDSGLLTGARFVA